MLQRARLLGVGSLLVASLSGCPMTDDFYIDTGSSNSSGGDASSTSGGGGVGGQSDPGKLGMAGMLMPKPKPMPTPVGGSDGGGGDPLGACSPSTERCNGHDDNCNDLVDEQACNSKANGTVACAGFVIASRPDHGYMLCPTTPKTYADAQRACEQQSMRLAWLETKAENDEVAAKVHALTNDEVAFGANDIAEEGQWVWDGVGGFRFWRGDENGAVVDDAFAAWAAGTPNDDNGGEDCAVMNPANGVWGDRACSTQYAYLCEEPE
jgi:hypothetical protein